VDCMMLPPVSVNRIPGTISAALHQIVARRMLRIVGHFRSVGGREQNSLRRETSFDLRVIDAAHSDLSAGGERADQGRKGQP
jgi:hypothetical protein